MGRIRTVKPEFFKHEELFDAELETGLPLRLAYIGIWTICDREGRFKWSPRAIKSDVLPMDDVDFSCVLDALLTRGFLVKYASGGREFGAVPTFKDHQHINGREQDSKFPPPPEDPSQLIVINGNSTRHPRVGDVSSARQPHVGHVTQGEGKGREGNRKGTTTPLPPPDASSENGGIGGGGPADDLDFREKILLAVGADPVSGMIGPNGTVLGRPDHMAIAKQWVDGLGLSEVEVINVIRDVVAGLKQPVSSFRYFTPAMQRLADAKAAGLKPDPTAAGGSGETTAERILREREALKAAGDSI